MLHLAMSNFVVCSPVSLATIEPFDRLPRFSFVAGLKPQEGEAQGSSAAKTDSMEGGDSSLHCNSDVTLTNMSSRGKLIRIPAEYSS